MHFVSTTCIVRFFFIFDTFFKLFSNLTLFIFFFKTNTFGRAYCGGAAKSRRRAMHGGTAKVGTWQSGVSLAVDVANPAVPWILARCCRATSHGAARPDLTIAQQAPSLCMPWFD